MFIAINKKRKEQNWKSDIKKKKKKRCINERKRDKTYKTDPTVKLIIKCTVPL